MSSTPAVELTPAQKWVESLTSMKRWQVQVLSKRTRLNSSGNPVTLPVKIRRFAEGCPAGHLTEAINYLVSKAPYTGVVFNGETLTGYYVPTMTSWRRDDGMVQVKTTVRTDGTYTIVQDLVDKDSVDQLDATTLSSCSEKTLTAFKWDVGSIEALPTGTQGHTYAIQAVSRNEDGSFDYQLVHRQSLTQHMEEKIVEDDELHTVKLETWNNVYTDQYGSYCDETGTAISIPQSSAVSGSVVKVSVSENEDCTFRIQAQTETVKPVLTDEHSTHTIYEGVHDEKNSGQNLPLGIAPNPTDGTIKDYTSQKQPDGKYTNRVGLKVEKPVSGSSVEVRVNRKGRRVTTADTNQSAAASTQNVGVGGVVKVEKTPGGLYNNTVSTWDRSEQTKAAERCRIDLYSHTDSTTRSGLSAFPESCVDGSGTGGVVKTRTTEMDEEGSISQTLEISTERPVQQSEESWQVGIDGVTHVVRNRNQQNPASAPTFSLANIGKSVRNEKTPGGLYDVVESSVDRTSEQLTVGKDCTKTIYEHSDSTVVTDPTGTISDDHVDNAGGGLYRETSKRMNQNGSVSTTTKTIQEILCDDYEKSYRRVLRGLITTTTKKNTSETASDPGEGNVGNSSAHRKTPGGLYDLTTTELSASSKPDSAYSSRTVFEEVDEDVTMGTELDTVPAAAAGSGKYRIKTSSLDEYGFSKTVVRETTEKPYPNQHVRYSSDHFSKTKQITNKNGSAPSASELTPVAEGSGQIVTVDEMVNPGGSVDHVETTETAEYRTWSEEVDLDYQYTKIVYFMNATSSDKDSLLGGLKTIYATKVTSAASGRMPSNSRIHPSVQRNKFGLYDGTYTLELTWNPESAGGKSIAINAVFSWVSYTKYDTHEMSVPDPDGEDEPRIFETKFTYDVYSETGRGDTNFRNLVSGFGDIVTLDARIDPITKVYHVTRVRLTNVHTEEKD